MKKLTALLLCAALLLGASACGSTVDPKGSESPAEETTNTAYHDAVQSTLTYVGDYATLLSAVNTIVSAGGDATAAMQSIRTATGTRLGERVVADMRKAGRYLHKMLTKKAPSQGAAPARDGAPVASDSGGTSAPDGREPMPVAGYGEGM